MIVNQLVDAFVFAQVFLCRPEQVQQWVEPHDVGYQSVKELQRFIGDLGSLDLAIDVGD
jgi:hypothetical protein